MNYKFTPKGVCSRQISFEIEDDIVKNNLLSGYILKAYALFGFGRFNEAEKYIDMAKEIQKYEFLIYAFDEIKSSVID